MFTQQTKEEPLCADANNSHCDQVSLTSMDSQPYTNGSNDLVINWENVNYWRDIVLKQMYQSSNVSKGGLQECIENALGFHPESDSTTAAKESFHFGEGRNQCPLKTHWMLNGTQNCPKGPVGLMPKGSVTQSNYCNNTEPCKRAFFDILMSENFTQLCNLLLQNFEGVKIGCIFDFSSIDSRMKEGAYEHSPGLFHSDIQQVWTKLEKVGTELAALAKSLSDKSRSSYSEQMGGLVHGTHNDSKFEQYPTQESTAHFKSEIFTGAAQIPVVDGIQTEKEPLQELTTSVDSNETGLPQLGGKVFPYCNICRHEVKNQEEATICGNFSCPRKYYHTSCLTSKQLESYGPCWYCPSCLCQACLSDRDDNKIILCDGCDHGYHIYCTRPPLASIPEGKWFCTKCREGIRKARRAYLRKQKKLTKRAEEQKEAQRESLVGIQTNIAEFEESSNVSEENGFPLMVVEKMNLQCCHICHQEVENLEELKICGNFLCPHKYYHSQCLTSMQLDSYGPCWYCPSCLCRVCFSDRDDDKVILCDECDHGYHIYCTRPPLGSVPEGRWSCPKCVEASQCIRKPRKTFRRKQRVIVEREDVEREAYESLQVLNKERSEEVVGDCGGVDLLLAAAKTVNLEESLASLAMDS